MTDIIIIGAGPAGLTAAIYAARAGASVVVLDKHAYGGQVATTSYIDNYPGLPNIEGSDFAIKLYTHAREAGAEVLFEEVTGVQLKGSVKTVKTTNNEYQSRAVILANGASRRKLGVPGEDTFVGRGVSYCGTCDAAFFRDKEVAIVGGGNTALTDAVLLSATSKKVYLIHRRDEFRAETAKQKALEKRDNIELVLSSTVESIEGTETVQHVTLKTPDGEETLKVSGIFIAIGMIPQTDMYKDQIALDEYGYVPSGEDCATSIEGVWVAGDLRRKPLRQIVTATSDGAVAAVAAADYCTTQAEDLT